MLKLFHCSRWLGRSAAVLCLSALLCGGCTKESSKADSSEGAEGQGKSASTAAATPAASLATATAAKLALLGEEVERLAWSEAGVEHLAVLTQTPVFPAKVQRIDYPDHPELDRELRAYHFVKKGSAYKQVWLYEDAVRNCVMDVTAKFVKGSLARWEGEGSSAISYIYMLGCRSDVSPDDASMKVHLGDEIFTLRGSTPEYQGPGGASQVQATAVKPDPLLAKAAPALQSYALERWHCLMDYDSFWGQATCPPGGTRATPKGGAVSTP